MQKNTYYEDLAILRSVNDYKMETKKLKIRSFYLFHKCQLNCVQNIQNDNTEDCFRSCQRDLDEYFEVKQKQKIAKTVYYALPQYEQGSNKQYIIPENESFEYQKKCFQFEQDSQQKIRNLQSILDQRNAQYSKVK